MSFYPCFTYATKNAALFFEQLQKKLIWMQLDQLAMLKLLNILILELSSEKLSVDDGGGGGGGGAGAPQTFFSLKILMPAPPPPAEKKIKINF